MTLPLPVVAWAFTVAAAFILVDVFLAKPRARKFFRGFQFTAFVMAAYLYFNAFRMHESIPPPEVRIALIVICVLACSEILSRWTLPGGQRK